MAVSKAARDNLRTSLDALAAELDSAAQIKVRVDDTKDALDRYEGELDLDESVQEELPEVEDDDDADDAWNLDGFSIIGYEDDDAPAAAERE